MTSKEFNNQKTSSKINLKYNKITSFNEKKPKKFKLKSKKKNKNKKGNYLLIYMSSTHFHIKKHYYMTKEHIMNIIYH